MLSKGLTNNQIAKALYISGHTDSHETGFQSLQLNDSILERYCYCFCSIRYFQFVGNASYMASNCVTAYIESFSYLVVS